MREGGFAAPAPARVLSRISRAISGRAPALLRQFAQSGIDFLFYANYGGPQFRLQTESAEPLELTEPRLLKKNPDQRATPAWFGVEYNSQGDLLFTLTGNGARPLKAIESRRLGGS